MAKGSSTTTEAVNELPPEIRAAAIANLGLADEIGQIGHVQNQGPKVAGFAPQQIAGMQGMDQAANAFGMPNTLGAGGGIGMSQADLYQALTGIKAPDSTMGGLTGYSGMDYLNAAKGTTPAGQRAAIESMSMDPNTGASPTNLSIPQAQTEYWLNPATGKVEARPRPAAAPSVVAPRQQTGGGGGRGNNYQQPMQSREGGYTGFKDMFDGGGAGASGDTYGGALSPITNRIAAAYNYGKG